MFKYVRYIGTENEPSDEWRNMVKKILKDSNYQRQAIKLVESEMGITLLNGAITPSLMLSNAECVETEIMDELLENILFGYVDKDKTQSIMYVKDGCDVPYLTIILVHLDIKLKRRFQEKITSEIINQYDEGFEYETLSFFLMSGAIDIDYKKLVIDKIDPNHIYELIVRWESDAMEDFYAHVSQSRVKKSHGENDNISEKFYLTNLLNYMRKKLG